MGIIPRPGMLTLVYVTAGSPYPSSPLQPWPLPSLPLQNKSPVKKWLNILRHAVHHFVQNYTLYNCHHRQLVISQTKYCFRDVIQCITAATQNVCFSSPKHSVFGIPERTAECTRQTRRMI